jgi:hypothetical protein
MSETWYEVVSPESPLTQGDLIFDCPLLAWVPSSSDASLTDRVSAFQEDVIVMTQACDRAHQKVENVVLCPHVALSAFQTAWQNWMASRGQSPSAKAWKRTCDDIASGYVWNQAFLERSDNASVVMEVRVVDFHDIFTIPRSFIELLLVERKMPRLRLLPPYREHLSQAFARFFMRVGLPQPVRLA